jgi:hypothetical protein
MNIYLQFVSDKSKNKFKEEFYKYIKDNKKNLKIYDYYSYITINCEYHFDNVSFMIDDIKMICKLYEKINIEQLNKLK